MVAVVKDGNDVGMIAEPAHGLGFAGYPGAGGIVQAVRLD